MKAKELNSKDFRIGNLVKPLVGCLDHIAEITYLSKSRLGIDLIDENYEEYLSISHELKFENIKPIPLTEEWLLNFGFENWGIVQVNEFESYVRFVLFNVINGTSNYEVHFLTSNYGGEEYKEIIYSIDDGEPQRVKETSFVHNLQNHYFLTVGYEINE